MYNNSYLQIFVVYNKTFKSLKLVLTRLYFRHLTKKKTFKKPSEKRTVSEKMKAIFQVLGLIPAGTY